MFQVHPSPASLSTPDLSRRVQGLMTIAVEQVARNQQKVKDNARIYELDRCLDLVKAMPDPPKKTKKPRKLKGGL